MTSPGYERRNFKRWAMNCPISLVSADGKELCQAKTLNISDGGAYVAVPAETITDKKAPRTLGVQVSVPRTTPNTYMLEQIEAQAVVARADCCAETGQALLALSFVEPIHLDMGL